MRNEFLISLGGHIAAFFLVFALSGFTARRSKLPEKVYRVRILPEFVEEEKTDIVAKEKPKPLEKTLPVHTTKKVKPKAKPKEKQEKVKKEGKRGEESKIRLDDENFSDFFYINLLVNKVSSNWKNPARGGITLRTTVYFIILRDGRIKGLRVEKSSGSSIFDESAREAIRCSIPFPELPEDYTGDHLGVHFEFEHIP